MISKRSLVMREFQVEEKSKAAREVMLKGSSTIPPHAGALFQQPTHNCQLCKSPYWPESSTAAEPEKFCGINCSGETITYDGPVAQPVEQPQKKSYIPELPEKPPRPREGDWNFCSVCWRWIRFDEWFKHIELEKSKHGNDIYEKIQEQRKNAKRAIKTHNKIGRTEKLSKFGDGG